MFYAKVPDIQKPVWAMVVVTDSSAEMTPQRLRESAQKLFRKMEWDGPRDVAEG